MEVGIMLNRESVSTSSLCSNCAKIAFFVYLGVLFFGTTMPFQEKIQDVSEIATSNVVNQYLFSALYLLASVGLIGKWRVVYQLILQEKWLFIFIGWALLSVLWSEYTTVSFKRWLQLFGSVLICVSALVNLRNEEEILACFKAILLIYLPLTIASIILVPGAVHLDSAAWRGLAPHKNILGQACLVSLLIWIFAWRHSKSRSGQSLCLLGAAISFVLLVGSKSMTSLLTALILLSVYILAAAVRKIIQPFIGSFSAWLLTASLFACYVAVLLAYPEILSGVVGFFGRELNLTGRSDLWARVMEETSGQFILGWGYGGFWVVNSSWLDNLYSEFIWLPNQSHLGYLDILVETGIVGCAIVIFLLLSYFRKLAGSEQSHLWKWFVIMVLIINITESTLLKANTLTGTMFLFSYLFLMFENRRRHGMSALVQGREMVRPCREDGVYE